MSAYWIYNNKKNIKHDKIEISQCAEVLSQITESELGNWFAWQKGWQNWKPVQEVPELMQLYKISEEPPPFPPPPPEDEPPAFVMENVSVATQEPVVLQKIEVPESLKVTEKIAESPAEKPTEKPTEKPVEIKKEDLRKHPRYNIRFKVIIENDIITFRSFTSNISLGGIALEHSLPEKMLSSDCKIYISDLDNSETIMFKIKPIRRGNDHKYFSFEGLDEYFTQKLDAWLKK